MGSAQQAHTAGRVLTAIALTSVAPGVARAEDLSRKLSDLERQDQDYRLHAHLPAAALAPVEEEHLDPIRRSRHDRRAEVGAIADWYTAEYPGRRGPDDLAGGIEAVDAELQAIGWQPWVHVVHVAADDRLRRARLHLIFNSEVSIEGFLCIVRRRCTSSGD